MVLHCIALARWERRLFMTKWKAAINAINAAVLILGEDNRLVYCNTRMRQEYSAIMESLQPGVLIDEMMAALMEAGYFRAEGDPGRYLEHRLRQIHDREAVVFEAQPIPNRWLRVEQTPTPDGGLMIIGYDITDLRKSGRRLETILDSLHSGLIYSDLEGKVLLANAPARTHFLDQASEIAKAPSGREHRLSDGRWILKTQQEDEEAGTVTLISDLTALKVAEYRIQDTFDRLDIELSRYDKDHCMILCNSTFRARFSGLEHLCQPGVPFPVLFEAANDAGLFDIDGTRDDDWKTIALIPHMKREPFVLERMGANGRWRQVNMLPTDDGGTILTAYDITERKRAEAEVLALNQTLERRVADRTAEVTGALVQLKETQARLVQQEKLAALGSLVAGIAHEINTPLGVAVTAASYLEEAVQALTDTTPGQAMTNDEIEARESLTKAVSLIMTNLERAARLIESFKQVSVDQVSEMRRSIDMVPYVEQIVQTLEPQLRQGRHTIVVEGPSGIIAETYPGVIAQILSNLVMNAILHGLRGREEGRILLRCEQILPNRLQLSVADDGIGISPSIADRIFEPFFTTRRREGGTGLGLHIVQNLVLLTLEGQIRIDQSHRPGLRIVIDMPNISPLSG